MMEKLNLLKDNIHILYIIEIYEKYSSIDPAHNSQVTYHSQKLWSSECLEHLN